MTPGPAFYTLAVVAEMLQCSRRYVQKLARESLPAARYGRAADHPRRVRLFLPREVERLVKLRRRYWETAPRARRVKPFVP